MEVDLKKQNNRNVFLIILASIVLSAVVQFNSTSLLNLIEISVVGSGSLVLSAIILMITNILPQDIKHKLIFTRSKNELPACRINQLCKSDPRIEYGIIQSRWPEIFSDEIEPPIQNSRWYQNIYKTVKDEKEILQSHRNFLLYRDAFTGLFLILIATLGFTVSGIAGLSNEVKTIVILIQFSITFFTLIVARFSGNRFVVNTVALAV